MVKDGKRDGKGMVKGWYEMVDIVVVPARQTGV